MSQLDIATLTILFEANLAKFESQMTQASNLAKRHASEMSRAHKQSARESREAMELLGDTIGIRLPRELRKVISESSLVGPALAAAFKVGVVGAIVAEVIDLLPKIKTLSEELVGFGDAAKQVLKDVAAENENLRAGFDKIRAAQQAGTLIGLQGTAADHQKAINSANDLAIAEERRSVALVKAQEAEKALQDRQDRDATRVAVNRNPLGFFPALTNLVEPKTFKELKEAIGATKKAFDDADATFEVAKQELKNVDKETHFDGAKEGIENVNKLKSTLESLHDAGARADAGSTDPFTKIFIDRAEAIRNIENQIAGYATASADTRKRVEEEASVAIAKVNIAAGVKLQEFYQKLDDDATAMVDHITSELSKLRELPSLAAPTPEVTSGHGFLDVNAQQLADATSSVGNLKDATLSYLNAAQTETERYASIVDILNASQAAGLISIEKLNDVTKKLNPNFQRMQELGREAARTLVSGFENAVIAGGGVRDILAGILEDLARIILEAALNPFEKSLGGFFTNLLGGLTGGIGGGGTLFGADAIRAGAGRALGGSVNAGTPYVVGEHGPELMVPSASGSIVPNGALKGGDTYYIDARGADAGVEQRVMRAIDASRKQAVRESVVTIREQSLRST
jgi:hypothetical protein